VLFSVDKHALDWTKLSLINKYITQKSTLRVSKPSKNTLFGVSGQGTKKYFLKN